MKNTYIRLAAVIGITVTSLSCVSDDLPVLINEDELITTVEYRLTNTMDASNVVILRSVDADADGPDAPIITTTGTLRVNSSYTGAVQFLNESTAPVEDITEEVAEESDEHEVFYITTAAGIQITKTDTDSSGNLLGLQTTFQTGSAVDGELLILLRHEPKKPNNGTLSDAAGETDVQVSLPFTVQ